MATRRMFSKKITNSAKFLTMPLETQALYFHLAQNADDDGVAEGFTVMRMVGSCADSMSLLRAKGYIDVLNEDLVVFVVDWLEHNKIRADRKVDSMYKDLLLNRIPEVKVLEPKERKDRVKGDDNGTSQGQPKDGIGKDRLGKVRIVKDNKTINDFFESVWCLYPKKIGKGHISPTKIKKLYEEVGKEQFIRCIERYKEHTKGKDMKYVQNGSTFFNTGYIDFLDINYKQLMEVKPYNPYREVN